VVKSTAVHFNFSVPFYNSVPPFAKMPPSLKQRLVALSLASSSPTSPLDSSSSYSSSSRRHIFNHPWKRSGFDAMGEEEPNARDKVQEVMGKVIFQAGVDFE